LTASRPEKISTESRQMCSISGEHTEEEVTVSANATEFILKAVTDANRDAQKALDKAPASPQPAETTSEPEPAIGD